MTTKGKVLYKVEHHYIYGWDDAGWTDGGEPTVFQTEAEAQEELDVFLRDVRDAVANGDMEEEYDPADYRIVPVKGDA